MSKRYLFIDRDGTLIEEPSDFQVDALEKLVLVPQVIPQLLRLVQAGFHLVMITNQDGLGSASFPSEHFEKPHNFLINLLAAQGIVFEKILICPHLPQEGCECRKPRLGLLHDFLRDKNIDWTQSFVIGDRESDLKLAENLKIKGLAITSRLNTHGLNWKQIADHILTNDRKAQVKRTTKETDITVAVDLDQPNPTHIKTGLGFFDHMLEQLAKHSGLGLNVSVSGDLHIDEHHTVEDTALALGQALKQACGDNWAIGRYGFFLPMDEANATVGLDVCGRAYFIFEGNFGRDKVGDFSTEMVPHFFRSLSDAWGVTLHIRTQSINTHHGVEVIFKAVGRTIRQALNRAHDPSAGVPSTKGML